MSDRCRIVTTPDGTKVRVQGDADPAALQSILDAVRADEARRCHAISAVPMPQIAQRIHGRETYWCGLYRDHDGPHRWPEDGHCAEWTDEPA
ncbi:MAG TPA: hypothetical protein VFJ14_07700 [Nocardioidaceae bacterium]|nr:hypothetical protein [Nocardioidaceae bacterium]